MQHRFDQYEKKYAVPFYIDIKKGGSFEAASATR
jgi:hypothetical protein